MPILESFSSSSIGPFKALRFKNTKYRVINFISTPTTSFQVRIQLTTSNFDYTQLKTDGSDLRFWQNPSFTSPISYWVERWVQNGTSVIWVNIPVSGTTSIYMTYGDTSLTSISNIDNVMDEALLCWYYGSGAVAAGAQAFQTLDFVAQDIGTNIANYDWVSGVVAINNQGSRSDYVSLRWKGWLKPTTTGTATIYFTTDDGQRIYIGSDSTSLSSPPASWNLSSWIDQGPTEYSTAVTFSTISPKFIWNEWFETAGGATSKLGWTPPSGSKSYPITTSQLRAPKYASTFGDPFAYSATVSVQQTL